MKPSERPFRLLRTAALALLGLSALPSCEKAAPPAFERPPSPVTVVAAEKREVPVYLDEIGKCVARESVSIVPQVSGRITEVHFADGADVKKGDPLFTIDPRPFEAKLGAAKAALAQAQATLNLARQEVVRIEKLTDPSAVSQQDRDIKKSAVDTAEALVLLAQSGVETATLDLEYCSIRSPIDGRAGHRLVDPGNVVMANAGTVLLVVQRLDPLFAEFTVIEEDLTSVQKSMSSGKLSAEVRFPDEPGSERIAELTFLDNAVQGSTGTVRLRATIPNADHRFWPGRFVKVRLVLGTIPGAVLVPETATQLSVKGPFVFVVKDDSTAELRPVTKGQRQGDRVVIEKGLEAGEKVVIDGQVGVMPGGRVRIVEPAAPPGGPAAAGAGAAADPPPQEKAPTTTTQKPPKPSGGGS